MATHQLDAPQAARPALGRPRCGRLIDERRLRRRPRPLPRAGQPRPACVVRALPPVATGPRSSTPSTTVWPSHSRATRAANAATFGLNDAAIAVSAEVRESMAPRWRPRHAGHRARHRRRRGARRCATERDAGAGRARHRPRRAAGRDRGQLPGPEGLPRPVRGRPPGRPPGPSRCASSWSARGRWRPSSAARHASMGLGSRLQILGLPARRAPRHRRRRPVRAGLAPRGSPGGGDGGLRRRRARGGHRRGRPGRGGRTTASRAGWCRSADPTGWPTPSPSWPTIPTSGPGSGRGAAAAAGRFSAPRSELEIEAVYRRALDAGAPSGRHRRGHADRGDARRARRRTTTAPAPTTAHSPDRATRRDDGAGAEERAGADRRTDPLTSTPGLSVAWSPTVQSWEITALTLTCTCWPTRTLVVMRAPAATTVPSPSSTSAPIEASGVHQRRGPGRRPAPPSRVGQRLRGWPGRRWPAPGATSPAARPRSARRRGRRPSPGGAAPRRASSSSSA